MHGGHGDDRRHGVTQQDHRQSISGAFTQGFDGFDDRDGQAEHQYQPECRRQLARLDSHDR